MGTGAAVPIGKRGLPCIALKTDGSIYLFDTGEACQYRLLKAGLGVVKVKAIFITHLHGDHFLGLLGMLQSMHMLDRRTPLYIYAPRGLKEILQVLLPQSLRRLRFPLYLASIAPWEKLYRDSYIEVIAYPVVHGSMEAYGFIIDLVKRGKQRIRIVYTGDTRPCRSTVIACRGADILVHEATFTSDLKEEAYQQGHSTAGDAGYIARLCGVETLILTHISARYDGDYPLYIDAYRFFNNVIVARDYMSIIL